MKDYQSALDQISEALHMHDLWIIDRRYRHLKHEQRFDDFCLLQDMYAQRIAYWAQWLEKRRKEYALLEEKARLYEWYYRASN